jgi:NIPSNAP
MIWQLRTYRLEPEHMTPFLSLWREHIVPAREDLGFVVRGGWFDEDDGYFTWIVGHDAPNGWEAAEQSYYASPRRESFPHNPREFITDVQTRLLSEA